MVRRRTSLIRGSHYNNNDLVEVGDHHLEHVAVVNGIRASFVAPQHRHSALLALYDQQEQQQQIQQQPATTGRLRYSDTAATTQQQQQPPGRQRRQSSMLTNLYNKNPKRYSWARPVASDDTDREASETSRLQYQPSNKPIISYQGLDLSFDSTNNEDDDDNDESKKLSQQKLLFQARLFLILCAILYGTSFPLIKILDDSHMPVGISLTIRFGLASLVTFPWLVEKPTHGRSWKMSLPAVWAGMEVGLWDAIGFLSQAMGMVTEQSNKTAFLCSLDVIVVPLLDTLIDSKPFERMHMMAAGMAILGVGLLELDDGGAIMEFTVGDAWSLIQPLAFGIGFWRTEHVLAQYPEEANRITAAQLLACFLLSATYTIIITSLVVVQEPADDFPSSDDFAAWFSSPAILLSLLWTGIMTMALTVYLETVAMQTASAAETTLLMSSEPFWAALFAWMLVGERLGAFGIVGGTLIVGACITDMW